MTFTSETARIAGSKKKKIPAIKSLKDSQWRYLEGRLVDNWSLQVAKHMEQLWRSGERQAFMDNYLSLLNYFKPKLGSQLIRSQSEIIIKVVNPEDNKDITEEI